MSNKKHIDRLFQEKFKDFEAKPSDAVWQNIQKELNPPKKTGKPITKLWSKWAAIAAVLLIFVTVGVNVFTSDSSSLDPTINGINTPEDTTRGSSKTDSSTTNTSPVTTITKTNNADVISDTTPGGTKASQHLISDTHAVTNSEDQLTNSTRTITTPEAHQSALTSTSKDSDNSEIKQKSTGNALTNKATLTQNPTSTSASTPTNYQVANSSQLENNKNINSTPTRHPRDKQQNTYATTTSNTNTSKDELFTIKKKIATLSLGNLLKSKTTYDLPTTDASLGESIEDAIAKLQALDNIEKESITNKWSVNATIAPVYFNSLGKGSSIDEQFVNNTKDGEVNMSYGVQVGYALNDKLKLRSGVNKLNLSYDTAGVIVYQSVSSENPDIKPMRHIDFEPTPNGESLSVISTSSFNVQQINSVFNDKFNAALSQRMSYIEVPLELEYTLIKKQFGLHIIGGMSTFFLSDNQVVTEFENYKTKIGEANNINNISFSTNIGLGLNYDFSKAFSFNLEPTFKYQLNTYNESSGNFKPYIIGVYSGFSYKF